MEKSIAIAQGQAKQAVNNVLSWYDENARSLPWRYQYNDPAIDPYKVWMSEIMLQQTTVAAVKSYFEKFTKKWPTIHDLAAATQDEVMHEWAGLGYYSRARNLHKAAQIVSLDYCGNFPQTAKELQKLPGVGDYTSAAIATIAFHDQATVVDGNIERIISRITQCQTPLPKAKVQLKTLATPLYQHCGERIGDFAQALMDIGARICTPKKVNCTECPLASICLSAGSEDALKYPVKTPKKKRPVKYGFAYWVTNDSGDILLHRRPDKGILAQTLALPTSDWMNDYDQCKHLETVSSYSPEPTNLPEVKHVFTHFTLYLKTYRVRINKGASSIGHNSYEWHASDAKVLQGLPTLFNKVYSQCKDSVK